MDYDHNNNFDERGVVKDGVGAAFGLQAELPVQQEQWRL